MAILEGAIGQTWCRLGDDYHQQPAPVEVALIRHSSSGSATPGRPEGTWRLELTAPCLQKLHTLQKLTVQLTEHLNALVLKQGDASDSLATQLDLHVACRPQVQLLSLHSSCAAALPPLQLVMLTNAQSCIMHGKHSAIWR